MNGNALDSWKTERAVAQLRVFRRREARAHGRKFGRASLRSDTDGVTLGKFLSCFDACESIDEFLRWLGTHDAELIDWYSCSAAHEVLQDFYWEGFAKVVCQKRRPTQSRLDAERSSLEAETRS